MPLLKKNPDRLKIQKIKTSNGVFGILFFLIILTIYLLPIGIVFANTSGVTLTVNVATCGDGAVDIGEQCDDNNRLLRTMEEWVNVLLKDCVSIG